MTVPTQVQVRFITSAGEEFLQLDGGHPGGGDSVHKLVGSWVGWRRTPRIAQTMGWPSSRYQARAWVSAMLPLVNSSKLAIRWDPGARERCEDAIKRLAMIERLQDVDMPPFKPGLRVLMPHQTRAVQALQALGHVALFTDDMGLGKTTTALTAWANSRLGRLLVVCPKSIKLNWVNEIAATLGDAPKVYLIDGTAGQRNQVLSYMNGHMDTVAVLENTHSRDNRAIAIVNYDLLAHMSDPQWKILNKWTYHQAVVCDEFHYCKEQTTKRSKKVLQLLSFTDFRVGMTGTPVRNTVEDLFNQIEMLRAGTWISYHDFADRHLIRAPLPVGPNQKRSVLVTRGGKNLEELAKVVNTLRFGRRKEEVLTLPPKVHTKPMLELEGRHLEVYQTIKREAVIQLEKLRKDGQDPDAITVFHPLAKSAVEAAMRCEMLAQGFISGLPEEYAKLIAPTIASEAEQIPYGEGAFAFPKSAKLAWVLEAIEDLLLRDRQVVVFSRFNAPLFWLQARQTESVLLTGASNTIVRQQAIEHFSRRESKVMFCQVKLAEGFNLTCAQDVIFLGRDWSPAINAQAEARCHRIGTTGTVNIQIPMVVNSIERLIDRKLSAKEADAEQAMKHVTVKELVESL